MEPKRVCINQKKPGDSGYICFYKSKQVEVYAPTSAEAQQLAAKHLKAKKTYEVKVYRAEDRDGNVVEQSTAF